MSELELQEIDVERKIKEMTVALLEPDKDTNNLLTLKLELSGYQHVISFESAEELLNYVSKGVDDCLFIIDLLYSDENWPEVKEKVFQDHGCPAIVITSIPSQDEIGEMLTIGASDVIVKPFDMEIFILKVEKVLTEYYYDKNLTANYGRNERLFLNVLQVMARVTEARFPFVQFHSENVARYARILGKLAGLPKPKVRLIGVAGVLHDLGKIGVREEVLNKPGALTDEEYEMVKKHPLIASEVLNPISEMNIVLLDVRHHHEWYDGTGYPDGFSGEDIPVGGRILHIAEAYDTMVGQRVYKDAFPKEDAVRELLDCAGTQFDPDLAKLFVNYLEK